MILSELINLRQESGSSTIANSYACKESQKIPNAALSLGLRQLATTTWHMRGPK